jgi:phosphatidylethanolamine-binding protein (PEBP) family uncharacterized protein
MIATLAQVLGSIASVEQAFQDAQIVPDVTSTFNPIAQLSAVYLNPSSQTGVVFEAGAVLTTNETTNEPEFWITYNDSSFLKQSYVIAMVDPDAPTPQNRSLAQIRHFVGGDFVISSTAPNGTARLTNTSAAIAEYISPGPPTGSDPHRYTMLLFKQPENFNVVASALIQPNSSFEGFNVSAFASSVGLGNPIAGTYFLEGPAGSTVTPSTSASTSVATAMPSDISFSNVKQTLSDAGVVPDVTLSFNPVALLDVAYTSANSPVYVIPGGNLTTPETENIPSFWLTYTNASLVNETFTLIMVDPDAPTPQNQSLAQIRHLILGDLQLDVSGSASAGTALLRNSTPALSDYFSPGPPAGSDPHRYTFMLYVQPSGFQQNASILVNASTPITGFNLTSFVETVGLGSPLAGTFFFEGPFNGSTSSGSKSNGVTRNIDTGFASMAMVVGAALVMNLL